MPQYNGETRLPIWDSRNWLEKIESLYMLAIDNIGTIMAGQYDMEMHNEIKIWIYSDMYYALISDPDNG